LLEPKWPRNKKRTELTEEQLRIAHERDKMRAARPHAVRAKTTSMNRFSKMRLKVLQDLTPEDPTVLRPMTRADCANVPRPCPFVSCKHNLYLEVNPENGSIKLVFPDIEPHEMHPQRSCALDAAENETTLEELGKLLNITRERARQLEEISMRHASELLAESGLSFKDLVPESERQARSSRGAMSKLIGLAMAGTADPTPTTPVTPSVDTGTKGL
jgi:hypothetical protein